MWPRKQGIRVLSFLFLFVSSGFFSWGDCPPRRQKFCPSPPTDYRPRFLTRACLPQLSFVTKNFIFFPHFSLNFEYSLAQNCIRKLYFMLKTPKFALIVPYGDIFGLSGQFFQVPPHLTLSTMWVPPIWSLVFRGVKFGQLVTIWNFGVLQSSQISWDWANTIHTVNTWYWLLAPKFSTLKIFVLFK